MSSVVIQKRWRSLLSSWDFFPSSVSRSSFCLLGLWRGNDLLVLPNSVSSLACKWSSSCRIEKESNLSPARHDRDDCCATVWGLAVSETLTSEGTLFGCNLTLFGCNLNPARYWRLRSALSHTECVTEDSAQSLRVCSQAILWTPERQLFLITTTAECTLSICNDVFNKNRKKVSDWMLQSSRFYRVGSIDYARAGTAHVLNASLASISWCGEYSIALLVWCTFLQYFHGDRSSHEMSMMWPRYFVQSRHSRHYLYTSVHKICMLRETSIWHWCQGFQ